MISRYLPCADNFNGEQVKRIHSVMDIFLTTLYILKEFKTSHHLNIANNCRSDLFLLRKQK
jgi:hypothetical protein